MRKTFISHYLQLLAERKKRSRVYAPAQRVGLSIAGLLGDHRHKTLYIKLAGDYDAELLIALAKDIAQRRGVRKKGAYFMRVFKRLKEENAIRKKTRPMSKKQLRLKLKKRKNIER